MVASFATRFFHGPSRPKFVIDSTVACGAAFAIARGSNSCNIATSEPGDQTTPFADAINPRNISTSDADDGSITTDCLEHARNWNNAPSSPAGISAPDAVQERNGSPLRSSILMTVAPASARIFVTYAPATPLERSTTTSPVSGGFDTVPPNPTIRRSWLPCRLSSASP